MYVCVCNAVTEDDVLGCLAEGARSTKEVRAACGMKPACGLCTKRLCGLVSRWRTADELADMITGGPSTIELVRAPAEPAAHPAAAEDGSSAAA